MIAMRKILLGGIAAAALAAPYAPAQAQVQSPGWFGSITGWYSPWNDTGDKFSFFYNGAQISGQPEQAWGGRAYLGYRFGQLDVALGLQGTWFGKGQSQVRDIDGGGNESFKQRANYWVVDGEVGMNGADGNTGYRLFAGVRLARFDHDMSGGQDGFDDPLKIDERFWGIGPRVGASLAHRLNGGNFSLFGDIAAAYLFGHRHGDAIANVSVANKVRSGKDSLNLEGQVGVSYDIAPMTSIALGYRGEFWSNVHWRRMASYLDGTTPLPALGSADRLIHGPFVRLAYNIGAPKGAPAPMAAPAAVMAKSFIVFFDFDRSNLTPVALGTIKQAADAAKAGKSARVNVTGHADKSGADQYNMALSLRRANAVKDELVRQGVPAASIVVVGRGESQPLVPTADGVKEPQNRRVEIVLN